MLTVKGSGEDFQIGAENATVLCGNVPTANATVYIIDTVLMPPDRWSGPHSSHAMSGGPSGGFPGRSATEGSRPVDPDARHLESAPEPGPHRGRESRRRPRGLLRLSARGDEAAFAQLYDATSARVYGLAVRVVRDPAQAQEVDPGGLPRDVADRQPVRPRPGQRDLVADDDRAPQGRRPGPLGRGRQPPRLGVPRREPDRRPRLDRRRRRGVVRGPAGAHRAAPASPRSSARPSRSRTSAATHTRRWPRCSTCRSARPRPASGTD